MSDSYFELGTAEKVETVEILLIFDKYKRLSRKSMYSIYYFLVYPYLLMYDCLLWGNNYDNPPSQLICLKTKQLG